MTFRKNAPTQFSCRHSLLHEVNVYAISSIKCFHCRSRHESLSPHYPTRLQQETQHSSSEDGSHRVPEEMKETVRWWQARNEWKEHAIVRRKRKFNQTLHTVRKAIPDSSKHNGRLKVGVEDEEKEKEHSRSCTILWVRPTVPFSFGVFSLFVSRYHLCVLPTCCSWHSSGDLYHLNIPQSSRVSSSRYIGRLLGLSFDLVIVAVLQSSLSII